MLLLMLLLSGCRLFPGLPAEAEKSPVQPPVPTPEQAAIVFEEPSTTQPEETQPPAPPTTPDPKKRPRVAIIIDDMGYHPAIGHGLLELNLRLSFAFLPHAPFVQELNNEAFQKGRDILVHIPMEAQASKWDPGPGALYLKDSPQLQLEILHKDLAVIPHAIGANNHMGSKFTTDRQAMHRVLGVIGEQGLFFIDSFTTAKSTGMDEARKMGIQTNRRNVFLDNIQNSKAICRQLKKLVKSAEKHTQAIAIGHPYQATLDALKNCSSTLDSVELVPVHQLLK